MNKIEKNIVKSDTSNKQLKAIFNIQPFENKYFAYVEVSENSKIILQANWLHKNLAVDIDTLKNKINSYTTLFQVSKDFSLEHNRLITF